MDAYMDYCCLFTNKDFVHHVDLIEELLTVLADNWVQQSFRREVLQPIGALLQPTQTKYTTTEKELLAIILF